MQVRVRLVLSDGGTAMVTSVAVVYTLFDFHVVPHVPSDGDHCNEGDTCDEFCRLISPDDGEAEVVTSDSPSIVAFDDG